MRKLSLIAMSVAMLASMAVAQMEHQMPGDKKPLLSPRKQSEVTFADGKKVTVDYGAPSMRNRKIMGELVPFDKVWRTGANEATSFVTDTDLMVDGTRVPAGKYTLYTLPSANTWKLIINKQTGQWGTVYNQDQDLARIDMKKTALPQPVEQMVLSLNKTGPDSATLSAVGDHRAKRGHQGSEVDDSAARHRVRHCQAVRTWCPRL